jgi:hypothetical protein
MVLGVEDLIFLRKKVVFEGGKNQVSHVHIS